MIKEFKTAINNFLNDYSIPVLIKEGVILSLLISVTLILMAFLQFPTIMFGMMGFYLMARVFIEILRR